MRLTGGEARGRRLKALKGLPIRPTADRVREALFDILGARVPAARVLDVFAGTGAVGCEALSRGAARVVFVEHDRRALSLIEANLSLAAWSGSARVIGQEARRALRELARGADRFDVIFLDPPYGDPALLDALPLAAALIDPAGILVVEHDASRQVGIPPPLATFRVYRYGDTALTVCRTAPDDSAA